jgi:hypothetical protein
MPPFPADIDHDERAIQKVVTKLARAQDERDLASYRSCLTDQITIDQPLLPGSTPTVMSSDEWTNTAIQLLAAFDVTHHQLFNYMTSIDGDSAICEVDVSAVHQIFDDGDVGTLILGGRYILTLRRQHGSWLISARALHVQYQIGDKSLMDKAFSRAKQRQGTT